MSNPPISDPQGVYQLTGRIPAVCPHCQQHLDTDPENLPGGSFSWETYEPLPLQPELSTAGQIATPVVKPKAQTLIDPRTPAADIYDHPEIGGKLTVCVLCYGDFPALHRRCLHSVLSWIPPHRLDLRIGANQVCEESRNFFKQLPAKVYWDDTDRLKYPAMRQMLRDPACPIESRWLIWFDDDSYAVRPDWAEQLCREIIRARSVSDRVGMLGRKMWHELTVNQLHDRQAPLNWFRQAPWYRQRNWQGPSQKETPNGSRIEFAVGCFWAMLTEAMLQSDVPDPRLIHWAGDIAIGAQLWQNHWSIHPFNVQQEFVRICDSDPRGQSLMKNSVEKRRKIPWYAV